ncbi:hypothetical protein JM946_12625 [Steroidobacter sp. S1-65]|uniref:Uncharacterized protein n=1 Tax=Steroidobacter gossypii TaxID=2805490 RepID=A0ABS1WXA4_9GAMM|nr:hypothetical protein [Steroidobacter gossypii]MBM0105603.1 hypothetical protein [Steroidobacter gossypii]
MSSGLRKETIPANGVIVVPDAANFLLLVATGSPVNVKFTRDGSFTTADGVEAGFVKGLIRPWDRVAISGTPGATCDFFIGFEDISEDFTDYRRTTGIFEQQLASSLGDAPADVDVGASAVAVQLIGENEARRKVTVGLFDDAETYVRVSSASVTVNRGARLAPGQTYTFEGTGPVYAIRVSEASAMMWVQEDLY